MIKKITFLKFSRSLSSSGYKPINFYLKLSPQYENLKILDPGMHDKRPRFRWDGCKHNTLKTAQLREESPLLIIPLSFYCIYTKVNRISIWLFEHTFKSFVRRKCSVTNIIHSTNYFYLVWYSLGWFRKKNAKRTNFTLL